MGNLQHLLESFTPDVSIGALVLNMLLAATLAFILGDVYVKFGSSLSNRRTFGRQFVLLSLTTTLIITVVKSSLALSLGLVGALSIVRFRAAIKEPEELSYLFLTIAIGLGLGADQRMSTLVAFVIIVGVISATSIFRKDDTHPNLYVTITSNNPHKVELGQLVEALTKHCSGINLKRFDETNQLVEAAFLVDVQNFEELNKTKQELQALSPNLKISFLDNKQHLNGY